MYRRIGDANKKCVLVLFQVAEPYLSEMTMSVVVSLGRLIKALKLYSSNHIRLGTLNALHIAERSHARGLVFSASASLDPFFLNTQSHNDTKVAHLLYSHIHINYDFLVPGIRICFRTGSE